MQLLRDRVPLPDLMDRIAASREAFRREQIRKHGWSDKISCAACGDTGHPPGGFALCVCAAGEQIATARRRQALWADRIPAAMRGWTLATAPDQAAAAHLAAWLAEVIAAPRVQSNAIIYGRPGSGKTGLAIGALADLCAAGLDVAFQVTTDYLDDQRPEREKDPDKGVAAVARVKLAHDAGVLALDDLGAEKPSDWTLERIYGLMNHRTNHGKPTIITSNLPRTVLRQRCGDRVMRRLTRDDTALEVVTING